MREKSEQPTKFCNMFWASCQGIHSGHLLGYDPECKEEDG